MKGFFSSEESLESLKSLNSRESPGNGRPILSSAGAGGELCSPCEVARPQPNAG